MAAHVEEPSMQLTFGDAEGLGKRKQTRRDLLGRDGAGSAVEGTAGPDRAALPALGPRGSAAVCDGDDAAHPPSATVVRLERSWHGGSIARDRLDAAVRPAQRP